MYEKAAKVFLIYRSEVGLIGLLEHLPTRPNSLLLQGMCYPCAYQVMQAGKTCPLCRCPIFGIASQESRALSQAGFAGLGNIQRRRE
jgi:hypothetical protein